MTTRVALVTGASQGIGLAVAGELESQGWTVLAPSRQELDLSVEGSVEAFLSTANEPITGLVLNAAVNQPMNLGELDWQAWTLMRQTNLDSNLRLINALLPRMRSAHFGRVVVVSSQYSSRGRAGRAGYGITKAGLESLVRFVVAEASRDGVVANAVAPGFVDTQLTRRNNDVSAIQRLVERIPVGRLGVPIEVARLVGFLMRFDNEYITGQVVGIDGGWSCT